MRQIALALGLALAAPLACAPVADAPMAEAARSESLRAAARITAIDTDDRMVVMRAENGEVLEVVAGPEVRNFAQLRVGDTVTVDYARAVAARMAEAGDGAPLGVVAAERAAPGARPGAAGAVAVETTLEVVSYDAATGLAVVRDAEGALRSFTVHPDMRAFAAARRPGDRVRVAIVEAVAVSVTPRGA